MKEPVISVIVPFYGSQNDIEKCLKSLSLQNLSLPYELIIVESGNNPVTKSLIKHFADARVFYSDKVMTPGAARNLGVRSAQSSLLAFTDADCVVDPEWLLQLHNSLLNYQIVVGPVLNMYPFHPVASVDNLLQFIDFQKHGNTKVNHFPACNLGMSKELFNLASGFPEALMTGEDVIFSESVIKLSEGKLHYNKHAIVRHSGRKNLTQFVKHNSTLGFYRGLYNLKVKYHRDPERNHLLFSINYGIRRFVYITIKTLQWNPVGIIRLIFNLPLVLLGISAWVIGFFKGNKEYYLSNHSHFKNSIRYLNE